MMMVDRAQTARSNGRKSRGPTSAAGLARSSKNALRHGLRAAEIVLPNESAAEWEAHRAGIEASLGPARSYIEELLLERIALQAWRLLRAARVERSLAMLEINRPFHDDNKDERAAAAIGDKIDLLARYETAAERSLFRTLAALRAERENAPLEGEVVEPG